MWIKISSKNKKKMYPFNISRIFLHILKNIFFIFFYPFHRGIKTKIGREKCESAFFVEKCPDINDVITCIESPFSLLFSIWIL